MTHLHLKTLCAGIVLGVSCLSGMQLHAQDQMPVFRTGVAVVPITAVVRDSKNRIVRNLGRDDFLVREDGTLRPIVDFRATDRGPLNLALLVDSSGSMRGANLQRARLVVDRILNSLDGASDRIALFMFDKRVSQETPFTNDARLIRRALDNTDAFGVTSLYDAIAETSKELASYRFERQAVVVVTDGIDTSSVLSAAEVSGRASAIDTPVYIVSVAPQVGLPEGQLDTIHTGLSNLAYWTGGDLRRVGPLESTDTVVSDLIFELRQQYFLAIESASSAGWRRLDVRTTRQNFNVRARSGYFGTDTSSQSQ